MKRKASIVILTLFLATLIIIANGQIGKNELARGEVRFVTNESCSVKVDQVQFEEDGLVVQVTNTGTYNVNLDAHGPKPDHYFAPQTLQKLDAGGEWAEVPVLEDACVDADCLPIAPGETINMSVRWEDWYVEPLQPGTYRLTSFFTQYQSDGSHRGDKIEFEFGW